VLASKTMTKAYEGTCDPAYGHHQTSWLDPLRRHEPAEFFAVAYRGLFFQQPKTSKAEQPDVYEALPVLIGWDPIGLQPPSKVEPPPALSTVVCHDLFSLLSD